MPAGLLPIIYLAFISLGLPDSAIGSAWPLMATDLGAGLSWFGSLGLIISGGTIVSSLMSVRVVDRFGTGRVTVASVLLTAAALIGFSMATSFWQLCLLAVPYGLGAGAVDAALNAYVAVHYKSQHMSWLHCMWGVGASTGPVIMGACLVGGSWYDGFRVLGLAQLVICGVLTLSLPLWKDKKLPKVGSTARATAEGEHGDNLATPSVDAGDSAASRSAQPVRHTRRELLHIDGVAAVLVCFFCYSALEVTCGNWAASYLTVAMNVPAQTAASWASLFYIGITVGRALSGFISMRMSDGNMIRLGQVFIAAGLLIMLSPWSGDIIAAGFVLTGLGCAPVYPSIIHATPARFGNDVALELTGMQMAVAYVGNMVMSPLFGVLAQWIDMGLYPLYLAALLVVMLLASERVNRIQRRRGLAGAR